MGWWWPELNGLQRLMQPNASLALHHQVGVLTLPRHSLLQTASGFVFWHARLVALGPFTQEVVGASIRTSRDTAAFHCRVGVKNFPAQ